ncbi:MAG: histidine kinase [Geobacteraceae bacterium GWC2_58_44]|nr:MAG: histidine kinase [Geobacteraceae bacterium GWC2_58_44]HBG05860.1 histidine kinase [Geobacter sp.]
MSKRFKWKRHILLAIGFMVLFWICDALIDVLFFREESFLHELFGAEPRELWMRTFSASCLAGFFLAMSVLTERSRRAEAALRHSDELAGIFFKSTKDAICIIDIDGLTIAGANGVFLSKFALTEEKALGRKFPELAASHGLPDEVLAHLAVSAASGSPQTCEISYHGSDGEKHYEEVSTYPIGDPQQGIEKVLHVARDITVRRSSEALLKESEARYRAIFENTGTAMAIILPGGTLHMVNRGFESMTGFSREELEGKKLWTDFVSPRDREAMHEHRGFDWCDCGGLQRCFELQTVDRFGAMRSMAGNWAAITGTEQAVLSLVDISTQKLIEEALRESQATLAVAQRIARLGNWEWDLITDTVTWSEEMYRIFDVDPAGFSPTHEWVLQAVHPEDREMVVRSVNDAIYNKKAYDLDYRIVLTGGAVRTLSARAEVTYDAHGAPLRMVGTNQDVSWRNEAELALRSSEEKFSKAFHASPDSIVITRAEDGTYIDVNEAFLECTGYTREEVIGRSSTEIRLWADPDARMVMLRLLNQHGHVRNLDVRFRIKSGEIRELLWSADVIEYSGEACLIAISRDVTDQRHLEKELLESDARLFMKHEELKNLFYQMEGIRREWEETMDCISDMFILADQWGKIRRFNRAVETFTGKAHRDIVGRECLTFLEDHGLKGHLEAPGVELLHKESGKWFVLNRYAFPTAEVDGSTREVVIINDTTSIGLRRLSSPVRLAAKK